VVKFGKIPSEIYILGYKVPIVWTDREDVQGESQGWDEDHPQITLSNKIKHRSLGYQWQVLVHEATHITVGLMGIDVFLQESQAELLCRVVELTWRGLAGLEAEEAKASPPPDTKA
jgi:hypothetical protein